MEIERKDDRDDERRRDEYVREGRGREKGRKREREGGKQTLVQNAHQPQQTNPNKQTTEQHEEKFTHISNN